MEICNSKADLRVYNTWRAIGTYSQYICWLLLVGSQ